MFIVDAHEDIAYNALHHERDVRRAVRRTRELEMARMPCCVGPVLGVPETAMVGLPEHRRGGVGLVFATIFAPPDAPDAMAADAEAQLRYYQELAAEGTRNGMRLVTSRADLDGLVGDWEAALTPAERPVGFALLMEGADPLRSPAELEQWHARGFGVEPQPGELDSVADLTKLADALIRAGYSEDDISGIMGGNWLRVLRRSLPVGARPAALADLAGARLPSPTG